MKNLLDKLIRSDIKALTSYKTQDASGYIKLDAMENPYSLPEDLKNDWASIFKEADINRYPDPSAKNLKKQLSKAMKIPEECGLILGNGSDEIIQIISTSLSRSGQCVMSVDPSFIMYQMTATYAGMNYYGVPLDKEDFSINMTLMLKMIRNHKPSVIFLANPNNPTGNLFPEKQILEIIESTDGLVVIDEAYGPFHNKSFMPNLKNHNNLLIMGTVSKMGLAGLRLGFLVGSEQLLEEFEKVKLPYNINILTQIGAEFALSHKEVFDKQASIICLEREKLIENLKKLSNIKVYNSDANFVLIRAPKGQANFWFDELKKSGILIKNLNGTNSLLNDCLRITVGTEKENKLLISSLIKISKI